MRFNNPHHYPQPMQSQPMQQQMRPPMQPQMSQQQIMQQQQMMQQQMMQQPMYPNQMQPQMQPQMMQQPVYQQPMYPNQMHPQMMQQPMYPNQMQPQMMQQPMYPSMRDQGIPQPQAGRFTTPNAPQPVIQQPVQQPVPTFKVNTMQISNELQKVKTTKYPNTELSISTKTYKFTVEDILVGVAKTEDGRVGFLVGSCMEDSIDNIISHVYEADTSPDKIYKYTTVIADNIYGKKEHVLDLNFSTTKTEDLAKLIFNKYTMVKDKVDLHCVLSLNTQFTNFINDVLYINSDGLVNIDSFMTDYSDLMVILTNSNKTLADIVIDALEAYRLSLVDTLAICIEAPNTVEEVCLLNKVNINYIDSLAVEYNLDILPVDELIKLTNVNSRSYTGNGLFSLVDVILSNKDSLDTVSEFIVTYDKEIFEIFKSMDNKYFIRRM